VSFLSLIGDMVELSKHKQYRGGLDCSGADTTGHLSVYEDLFSPCFSFLLLLFLVTLECRSLMEEFPAR
jgi:hypothetical protein